MILEHVPGEFCICKAHETPLACMEAPLVFFARTTSELSLICPTDRAPADAYALEPNWRCLRVAGTLDFGLIGVLAAMAGLLAQRGISILAVSTFDTDYLFVKAQQLPQAVEALSAAGYTWAEG